MVADIHRPLMDELGGYAEAQREDARAVWRACCGSISRPAYAPRAAQLLTDPARDVRTFLVAGGRLTIAGRNYDYSHGQARRQQHIRFQPIGQTGFRQHQHAGQRALRTLRRGQRARSMGVASRRDD